MSILLVMGEGVDAELTAYLLTSIDKNIVVATTLADARQHLNQRLWSVVIVDTVMPDGSGLDLLRIITRTSIESGILVLSESTSVEHKVQALNEGADDYVVRPYLPAELLARVSALLRRFGQRIGEPEGSLVRVGDIELEVNELVVRLPNNRRVRLTPNEMRLLHYLMTHTQRVVEHEELSTLLFGSKQQPASANTIGVYMRRVRQKIEADPNQPRYIVTVRGSGYRFYGGADLPVDGLHGLPAAVQDNSRQVVYQLPDRNGSPVPN